MKAMILAAGYGTRLGYLTRDVPKPMLEIEGRPILAYIIGHLKRQGFEEIVVNLHYQPEMICRYFGDGRRWGVRLTYSYEDALLGTAGGLKKVAAFFKGVDNFLVQYGDVITDEDFSAMLRFHHSSGAVATLLVHERMKSNSVIWMDEQHRIRRFLERPAEDARREFSSPWVHSGVCIAGRELLDFIPSDRVVDLPRDVYAPLVDQGWPLFAWPGTGYRCAIDSQERLDLIRKAFQDGLLAFPTRES